jgi:hypothetical protein
LLLTGNHVTLPAINLKEKKFENENYTGLQPKNCIGFFLLFLIDFYSLKPENIVKKFHHVNFLCKTYIFSLILHEISLQHEIWYPIVDSKNHIQ